MKKQTSINIAVLLTITFLLSIVLVFVYPDRPIAVAPITIAVLAKLSLLVHGAKRSISRHNKIEGFSDMLVGARTGSNILFGAAAGLLSGLVAYDMNTTTTMTMLGLYTLIMVITYYLPNILLAYGIIKRKEHHPKYRRRKD